MRRGVQELLRHRGVLARRCLHRSCRRQELVKVEVPTLGESITEATIVSLERAVGDAVKADEVVAVLETDKVSVEVYAPKGGVLKEYNVGVDETVLVGQAVCVVDTDGVASETSEKKEAAPPPPKKDAPPPPSPEKKAAPPKAAAPPKKAMPVVSDGFHLSP